MRSLTVKLTLAFLLVGLIGAVLVAVFLRYRTQREFTRLVIDQNQQILINHLMRYYLAHGSWEGVESAFRPGENLPLALRLGQSRWDARRSIFLLTDEQGTIVLGSPEQLGLKLNQRALKQGIPLELNGERIGWLVFSPLLNRWLAGTPEGNFLQSVNRATLFSALAATGIALLVGSVLAYSLTRSLRELTAATRLLARGKLGHQVQVRSKDELGILAESFNQMSLELARSNELRRQMTANIAHDLRTPLSVIMGYTEALHDGKLQPTSEMFAVMHTEALHLSRLIDDLKTISLADAGELPLSFQRVSPEVLIKRAADAYRVKADSGQIELRVSTANDLPEVEVDVERMAQVIGNLMDNALRYTPAGGRITLSADVVGERVRLQVADSGTGIAAEDLPYIFERSYRGDKARRHPEGESGLGLSIAKSLVEAQGGSIQVESQVGVGTVFSIFLKPVQKEKRS